jgi:hypothetical protein
MYRRIVLICEVVFLASMAMGCTVCGLAGRRDQAASATATALPQTLDHEASPTAVPTDTATPIPVTPTLTPTPAAPTRTPLPSAVPDKPLAVPDSYRYQLVVEGIEHGQVVRMTVDGAYVREPGALRLEMVLQEGDAPAETTKFVRIQGRLYTYDPEAGGWIVAPDDEIQIDNLDFVSLLIQEIGLTFDGPAFRVVSAHEDVVGTDSTHYTADIQGLPDEWMDVGTAVEEGVVEVWVANDSGRVVKLWMAVVGKDQDGHPADATFDLLVFDVNEAIEVLPPSKDEIIREE